MNPPPWASCSYCDGVGGVIGDSLIPSLAGQSAADLQRQIADYRSGRRTDPSGMKASALVLLDPKDDVTVAQPFAA